MTCHRDADEAKNSTLISQLQLFNWMAMKTPSSHGRLFFFKKKRGYITSKSEGPPDLIRNKICRQLGNAHIYCIPYKYEESLHIEICLANK